MKKLKLRYVLFFVILVVIYILPIRYEGSKRNKDAQGTKTPSNSIVSILTSRLLKAPLNKDPLKPGAPRPMKIILLGYLRGGTTFMGEVLGVRDNTFYLYEPLFEMGSFVYFRNGEMCGMTQNNCGVSVGHKRALHVLDAVFKCDFESIKDKLKPWQFTRGYGDHGNNQPEECKSLSFTNCLALQTMRCMKSSAIVVKVARTDIALLESLMPKHPTLKIVHLIRDPRAVSYSRLLAWPVQFRNTLEAGRSLCTKMLDDHAGGKRLNRKYPNTVFTLFYEDFCRYPKLKLGELFDFTNYQIMDKDLKHVFNKTAAEVTPQQTRDEKKWGTVKKNSTIAAFNWRMSIPHGLSRLINIYCKDAYETFGYPPLKAAQDLKNESIPLRFPGIQKI